MINKDAYMLYCLDKPIKQNQCNIFIYTYYKIILSFVAYVKC